MMRNILVLCIFCVFLSGSVFCLTEKEIDSQVISVNPNGEYIVIKAGEIDGVEIGDGLIVHRDGEKLAEAQVVEVRPEVAAAEILNAEKEIKEGDSILIVKKIKSSEAKKEKKAYKKPKTSKWTTLLGSSGAEVKSAVPVETISAGSPPAGIETLQPGRVQVKQEGGIVKADIDTDPGTVFSYALIVLRENGYSVISSNRMIGVIVATKPVMLSLMKELWADSTASIEHKLVVSLEMKDNEGATELNASSFKEHIQKGKQVKFPVTKESMYYSDLVEIASKIKERAGR